MKVALGDVAVPSSMPRTCLFTRRSPSSFSGGGKENHLSQYKTFQHLKKKYSKVRAKNNEKNKKKLATHSNAIEKAVDEGQRVRVAEYATTFDFFAKEDAEILFFTLLTKSFIPSTLRTSVYSKYETWPVVCQFGPWGLSLPSRYLL